MDGRRCLTSPAQVQRLGVLLLPRRLSPRPEKRQVNVGPVAGMAMGGLWHRKTGNVVPERVSGSDPQ